MSRRHRLSFFLGLSAIVSFVGAGGCREKPESPAPGSPPGGAAPRLPAAPTGTPKSQAAPSAGVDAQDAPHSPASLPKSQPEAGWVKREPVRVFPAANLAGALARDEAIRLSFFRIRSAATCAYDLIHSDAKPRLARVLLIDTESAEDAYGWLSCQAPATETFKIGGETRVVREGGLHLHCWQGRSYVRVSISEADAETTEKVIRLLLNITGQIGRADRPVLLDAVPSDSAGLQRKWLVRHLGSLPAKSFNLAFPLDVLKTSGLLGLDKSTQMCIAQYEVPQGMRSNVVWVVRYSSTKAAYDAHANYTRFITEKKEPAAQSTNLFPPHGPFLIGTWTAEEESLQYMMPRIGKLLPQ
ncbi:MAG TPA: DUF6599 family protein [Phycisphaerae bacterium]|nr:DUF6599 family protein [Phycisphaerae bacterium]